MAKVNLFSQVRDFVEKINEAGGKPLYELTPEEAREVLRGVQEAETDEPDVERKEAEIEVGGGRMMRLEITKPKGVTGELGVIYYIHGGGWVMGDNITHRPAGGRAGGRCSGGGCLSDLYTGTGRAISRSSGRFIQGVGIYCIAWR